MFLKLCRCNLTSVHITEKYNYYGYSEKNVEGVNLMKREAFNLLLNMKSLKSFSYSQHIGKTNQVLHYYYLEGRSKLREVLKVAFPFNEKACMLKKNK